MTDWEHNVIDQLIRQDQEDHKRLEEKIDKLIADVSALKTKASMWGMLAGTVGGAVAWTISQLP